MCWASKFGTIAQIAVCKKSVKNSFFYKKNLDKNVNEIGPSLQFFIKLRLSANRPAVPNLGYVRNLKGFAIFKSFAD